MDRRIFFRNGLMGALSLPVLSISPFGLFQPENVGHWMRQVVKAMGVRRRPFRSADTGLQLHLTALEAGLAERDYYRESGDVYFVAGTENLFFYPLWLRRSTAGLTDLVLPVLARQGDGSWQTVITLTGYQVEAMARAAAALAEAGMPAADLLLPVRRAQATGGTFGSRRGQVQIATQMQGGQASTVITVRDGQRVVYEADFPSRHSLTAQAQTA